jgi:hypothetical protein
MPARKTPSKGGKPDKLMRDAIMLEIKAWDKDERGRRCRNDRMLAKALVRKGKDGDVPALKEINDRIDGKIPTLADLDDGGLKLEDLIHMSYEVARRRGKQEQAPLLEARDITPKDDER